MKTKKERELKDVTTLADIARAVREADPSAPSESQCVMVYERLLEALPQRTEAIMEPSALMTSVVFAVHAALQEWNDRQPSPMSFRLTDGTPLGHARGKHLKQENAVKGAWVVLLERIRGALEKLSDVTGG